MDSPQISLFSRSLLALGLDDRFARPLFAQRLSRRYRPVFALGFSNSLSCGVLLIVWHGVLTSIRDFVH